MTYTPLPAISVLTLGVESLDAARRFYADGFGFPIAFENEEIVFFQLNGLVLGTWLKARLAADMMRTNHGGDAMSLAHNVPDERDVDGLLDRLAAHGGSIMRPSDAPPHGGRRGYIADPDGHAWEIAWNPDWPIDTDGHVKVVA